MGVVANMRIVLRNRAACRVSSFTLVGFIDWLDRFVCVHINITIYRGSSMRRDS